MNKKINDLIPKAIDAIVKSGMATNGEVEKEYKGYIASMGASIIQSGLIATLAFYSNESSDSKANRIKLMDAIKLLINSNDTSQDKLLMYVIKNVNQSSNGLNNVKSESLNKKILSVFEIKISDALIALKLALRTFKEIEKKWKTSVICITKNILKN